MNPGTILVAMALLFLVFGYMGVPVSFALMAGVFVATAFTQVSLQSMVGQLFHGIDSGTLLAVPFFLLVGELMASSDVVHKMIRLSQTLVGHLRGGLAQVVTRFSMFFAGISGSSTADVAILARTVAPAMDKEGYDRAFTAALIASASTMANLIPPSIMAVVYGATGNLSIGGLFLAGVVPGLLIGIGLMIYSYFWGAGGRDEKARPLDRGGGRGARRCLAAGDPGDHHGRHPQRLVHAHRGRHGGLCLHPAGVDPAAAPGACARAAARLHVRRPAVLAAAGSGGRGVGLWLDGGQRLCCGCPSGCCRNRWVASRAPWAWATSVHLEPQAALIRPPRHAGMRAADTLHWRV